MRGNYQWFPTLFMEKNRNDSDKTSMFELLSPIHNLGTDKKYQSYINQWHMYLNLC